MDSRRSGDPSRCAPALWSGVVLLSVIGIGGAITRGVFLRDFATRADPLRQKYLDALGRTDPHAEQRAENLRQFDARFAAHPALTVLHILPGGLVLALAPLQFSARIRSRHIRYHPQEIFALSLWTGWLLTLGGAELWIRRTRSQGVAAVIA